MVMLRTILVLLCAATSSFAQENAQTDVAETQARQALEKLNWIKGPQTVPLFDIASINVPAGYVFLNPEDTEKFNTLSQNPSSGTEYLLAPDDLRWTSYFRFSGDGYVKDNEKIDAVRILESIRQGNEAGNKERRAKGWSEMTIIGWKLSPFYDSETKRLEWAINGKNNSDNSMVINFNTRILGRSGVTSAVLVADPQALDAAVSEFNASLRTYQYSASERYAAFKPGDKIAAYGLAALVTGGLAAVATKTGFWKTIGIALAAGWKLVAAALAGLFAFVRNLFKGRKQA
jgi:uncharacterized membrane-anchored protein